MSQENNRLLAERWFLEMWSKPAPEVADEIISADYAPEWVQIDVKGPAQVKHEIRYFRSVFPDLLYEIKDLAVKQDRVWVRYLARGTQMGKAWGFDATGRSLAFEGVTIFYFDRNGLIHDRWASFCFYDMLAELKLVPPLWELGQKLESQVK